MLGTVFRDLGFFAFCFAVFAVIGLPLARHVRGLRAAILLAPVLGYGTVGVVSTLLYVCGLSARVIFFLMVIVSILLSIQQGKGLLDGCRVDRWSRMSHRPEVWSGIICVCGTLLLLVPQWTGGIQFAVFQQNVNDTFGYLTSAEVFARESFACISQAGDAEFLQHPLWCQAQSNLSCRPTMMVLYAVAGQLCPSAMHEMHYTFLTFFFSCAALALGWLSLNLGFIRQTGAVIATVLLGWGFALGFWGQYILDINAWSQIASLPLLVSLFGLLITLVDLRQSDGEAGLHPRDHCHNSGVIVLVTAAAIYFYPENTVFHLVALSPVALWAWLRGRRGPALRLLAAVAVGLSLSLAYYRGTVAFFFNQSSVAGANINWWISTARHYFGRDGWYDGLEVALRKAWETAYPGMHNDGIAQLAFARSYLDGFFHQGDNWRLLAGLPFDALTGFVGLFFLTPLSEWPVSLQLLCRSALLALAIILIFGGLRSLSSQRDVRIRSIILFLGTMLLMAGVMVLRQQFWGAGKAISYAAPYLAIFFVLPALTTKKAWARAAAGMWLAGQLAFGVMRPFWAHDPHKLGRTPTYMPVAESKTTHSFDLGPLMTRLQSASCACVDLDISDPYLEHYMMLALYANGIPFRFDHPVYTYFGTSGRNVGNPNWALPADCRVVVVSPTAGSKLRPPQAETLLPPP